MQIREIMTRNVETASPLASLQEAAKKMQKRDIGFLPVMSEGVLVGVITDRDITVRGVARGLDPARTLVEKAMTANAVVLPENSDLEDAADLMEERDIRRLVVTDENEQPVGVVSKDRIALYLGAFAMENGAVRDSEDPADELDLPRLARDEGSEIAIPAEEPVLSPARTARDQSDPAARRR